VLCHRRRFIRDDRLDTPHQPRKEENMLLALLFLSFLIWAALSTPAGSRITPPDSIRRQGRFSHKQSGKRIGDDELVDPANEEPPSWTALDDMQVERLLRDWAP
jgi:hypothetical protein